MTAPQWRVDPVDHVTHGWRSPVEGDPVVALCDGRERPYSTLGPEDPSARCPLCLLQHGMELADRQPPGMEWRF